MIAWSSPPSPSILLLRCASVCTHVSAHVGAFLRAHVHASLVLGSSAAGASPSRAASLVPTRTATPSVGCLGASTAPMSWSKTVRTRPVSFYEPRFVWDDLAGCNVAGVILRSTSPTSSGMIWRFARAHAAVRSAKMARHTHPIRNAVRIQQGG